MSNLPSLASPERLRWIIPLAVFLAAFGLRLIGIGWGLPNELHDTSYHPDEPVVFGYSQAIEPTSYPWTPHFYNYGTLYLLVLRVSSDVTAAYSGGYDVKSPASVTDYIRRCHLAGRIISALAGAATALLSLLMLRRFTTEFGAVLGSLLIAFAPAFVVHSRFQTVDVFATFLLVASAYFSIRVLYPREGEGDKAKAVLRDAAWAGVFAGLSAGTKYTGILGLIILVVALLLARRPSRLVAGAVGVLAGIAAFLLVTPGTIVDSQQFLKDTVYEMRHTGSGHGLVFEGTSSGYLYHLGNLFLGVGTLMTLVAIAGLIVAAVKKQPWAFAMLAFFLVYYILIGRAEVKFLRYTFPLYVCLAAGFGWAMGAAQQLRGWGHAVVGVGLLGLGGADPGGLRSAAMFSWLMYQPDARDVVGLGFRQMAAGKELTVGLPTDPWYYTPALYPQTAMPRRLKYEDIDGPMRASTHPRVERYVPKGQGGELLYDQRIDWDVRLLTESRPDYVLMSNFELADPLRLRKVSTRSGSADSLVKQYEQFSKELQARYVPTGAQGITDTELVQDMMYVAPGVQIWKRKDLP